MTELTNKLEIGSGHNPTEGYIHLDSNPEAPHVEIVGDIRALISSDYNLADYPDLHQILPSSYDEIKAYHVIEHIQWLYQEALFYRLNDWLKPNGLLKLQTPDLDWTLKTYLYQKKRRWWNFRAKRFQFPINEHPDLSSSGNKAQFYKWINYRIYSGCSMGDYHHCAYTQESLKEILALTGFRVGNITTQHATIEVLARKPKSEQNEYYKG